MRLSFEGKTALVTGATRGIGRQIAQDLGAMGADLLLTGTDPEEAQRLNQEVSNEAEYVVVDFTDVGQTQSFLDDIRSHHIDVCVNNAGINRIAPIDETRSKDWDDVRRVNLDAPFRIIKTLSGGMKERGYGRIVNVSSIFGTISKPQRSLYSMTKFGLRGLTIASALDLASFGVLVNTVSPGFVDTELTKSILSREERAELAGQIPIGRFAEPAEISGIVLFLASSSNTYITAQNIIVDGGFTSA